MSNLIRFNTTYAPEEDGSVNIYVTDLTNTKIYEGTGIKSGDSIEANIGEEGSVGAGALIYVDNFSSEVSGFKSCAGYSIIISSGGGFLDSTGRISDVSVINQNSEIWSGI